MGWGAQQWLRVTRELTYGVRNAAPSSSDVIWVRLAQANPFTMRRVPQRQVIRSADASNRRRQVVAARTVLAGQLSTLLYPSQDTFWMRAASTLTSNDLASYTLDYYDGVRTLGYLGAKVQTFGITSAAEQDYVPVSVSWIAQQVDPTMTVLGQPADGDFPLEVPYEHYETAGQCSVGGSTLTRYSSATVTFSNVLVGTWDEEQHITDLYYCGRDVDLTFRAQYLSDTFRSAFEAQSPLAATVKWSRGGGANSITVNCQSRNYIGSITDEIPLDGPSYQAVSFQTFYDPSSGSDVTVTVV